MLFCKVHRFSSLNNALLACTQCRRDTYAPSKLCTGCSVRRRCCAICLTEVADMPLGKRFVASINAAEQRYDRAVRRADRALKRTLSPFAAQAAALEEARQRAVAEHDAAVAPFKQALDLAMLEVDRLRRRNSDLFAAEQIRNALYQAMVLAGNTSDANSKAFVDPAEAAMGSNIELYQQALTARQNARRAALDLADTRYTQLFGHLRVDQKAREMVARCRSEQLQS